MKRFLIALLAIAMVFVFVSCEDKVETPKEFTVTFNTNGFGEAPAEQKVEKGKKITEPEALEADHKSFQGWYKDSRFAEAWGFEKDTVTTDTVLYARWFTVHSFVDGVCTICGAKRVGETDIGYNRVYNDLIVSGTGAIPDYTDYSQQPWYSFRNYISEIIVEDGITGIGDYALGTLSTATSISLGASVERIGLNAIRYTSISEFVAPTNLKRIEQYAFIYCRSLSKITLNEGLEYCGFAAFHETKLKTIHLPSTANGVASFGRLDYLESVTVEEGNDKYYSIDGILYIKGATRRGVRFIPSTRETFELEAGISTVMESSVWGLHITDFDVPATVDDIRGLAFRELNELESITFNTATPPKFDNVDCFVENCSKLTSIYVPDESVDAYKATLEANDLDEVKAFSAMVKGISEKPQK